ncbi:hypothetical protein CROST_022210 [Clostridium felsineum]|uniref:Uncharacterized protein n=2 Tax=Clostridium felsineum TaxID=36839 RepID=A0A1S8KZT2_9CLOT|nr:hypothetical protein CROST_022210 [Clostridium felsineum]
MSIIIKYIFKLIWRLLVQGIGLVYILLKLLVIPGIIFDLLIIFLNFILFEKVNDFFFMSKIRKEIMQGMTLKKYKSILKNDYYKDRIALLYQIQNIDKYNIINDKNMEKINGKRIKCTTNEIIYNLVLKKIIKNSNIEKDKKSMVIQSQPIEKMTLINFKVLWKNLLNKRFWRFVYRKEKIAKYFFTVNRNTFRLS